MPLYRVVEVLPQATVRRVMLVQAPDQETARESPHDCQVLTERCEVDEGGEAYTAEVEEITSR